MRWRATPRPPLPASSTRPKTITAAATVQAWTTPPCRPATLKQPTRTISFKEAGEGQALTCLFDSELSRFHKTKVHDTSLKYWLVLIAGIARTAPHKYGILRSRTLDRLRKAMLLS